MGGPHSAVPGDSGVGGLVVGSSSVDAQSGSVSASNVPRTMPYPRTSVCTLSRNASPDLFFVLGCVAPNSNGRLSASRLAITSLKETNSLDAAMARILDRGVW